MAFAELKAFLGLDSNKFTAGIQKAEGQVSKFSKSLSGIGGMLAGAFSVGAIIAFGRKLLQVADDLQTAANVFGTSMETMIAWKSVMAESGIGAERFMKLFGRLASAQADVDKGLKTYTDSLDAMGIAHAEFVGLKVDKVMELLAKKYGEAADKNLFLGEAAKLLGVRGLELIEVFQRLNKEGMEKYAEGAKSAADGMKELATASDTIEKIFNTIILKAAEAVGAISSVGAAMGRLSVEKPKQGFLSTLFEGIGDVFYKGKFDQDILSDRAKKGVGAVAGGAGATEGGAFPATTFQKEAAAKKIEAERKLAVKAMDDAARMDRKTADRLDEFYRKQDELSVKFGEKSAGLDPKGRGVNADAVARMGGMIGGARPGLAIEDRAIRIQQEQLSVQREFVKAINELKDAFIRTEDRDEG